MHDVLSMTNPKACIKDVTTSAVYEPTFSVLCTTDYTFNRQNMQSTPHHRQYLVSKSYIKSPLKQLNNRKVCKLLLLVCVSFTIIGQPRNSVLIRRV